MGMMNPRRMELLAKVLSEGSENWVVVESWRYPNGSEHTFVSSRMTREVADGVASTDRTMPVGFKMNESWRSPAECVAVLVRKADRTEMAQPSFYQRLAEKCEGSD